MHKPLQGMVFTRMQASMKATCPQSLGELTLAFYGITTLESHPMHGRLFDRSRQHGILQGAIMT